MSHFCEQAKYKLTMYYGASLTNSTNWLTSYYQIWLAGGARQSIAIIGYYMLSIAHTVKLQHDPQYLYP